MTKNYLSVIMDFHKPADTIFNRIKYYSRIINPEAIIWIVALAYLITIDPYESDHLSFCLFHNLGINFCPGCGIGRSISMIFHGDFTGSFNMHPLGFFALIILLYRIITLTTGFRITFSKNKKVYHG